MKKIEEFSLTRIHLHENFEFLRKVCEKGDLNSCVRFVKREIPVCQLREI